MGIFMQNHKWSGEYFSDFQSESPCKGAHGFTLLQLCWMLQEYVLTWTSLVDQLLLIAMTLKLFSNRSALS